LSEQSRAGRLAYFWLLIACLAASFAGFAYPMYVIRPFRYQGARELAAALAVIEVRPLVEGVAVLLALIGLAWYWRLRTERSRRVWAIVGTAFVCLFAVLTRINVYELMFHPDSHPLFGSVQQAKVDPDDKVIAVKVGSEARAYPIRTIAYHHIINDVVGGEPIVATY
jgi:Protein of unknown function (DUF3179)